MSFFEAFLIFGNENDIFIVFNDFLDIILRKFLMKFVEKLSQMQKIMMLSEKMRIQFFTQVEIRWTWIIFILNTRPILPIYNEFVLIIATAQLYCGVKKLIIMIQKNALFPVVPRAFYLYAINMLKFFPKLLFSNAN